MGDLETLNLAGCGLSASGLAAFVDQGLARSPANQGATIGVRRLCLDDNAIGDAGVIALGKYVADAASGTSGAVPPRLEWLSLRNVGLSDSGAEQMSRLFLTVPTTACAKLRFSFKNNLDGVSLTTKGVSALQGLRLLKKIPVECDPVA